MATLLKFNTDLSKDLLSDWAHMISQLEQDKTRQNLYAHTEKGPPCCLCSITLTLTPI